MAFTVEQIAQALGASAAGQTSLTVALPRPPSEAGSGDLAVALEAKFTPDLMQTAAQVALVPDGTDWQALGLKAAILMPGSRHGMAGLTSFFDPGPDCAPGIHPSAVIDPSAEVGASVSIGAFVVIGARARIGDGARILPHVTIAEDAVIGPDALIHSGVRIGARVVIGARFIAHGNAVIGGDGFSFLTPQLMGEMPQDRSTMTYTRIHSLGSVVIGDDVELGAGSMIDRGTITDTRIGSGTKIDNLVQIGHNVQVGKACLLCGHVGVAGSVEIGDRTILGGKVGVADHVRIGADVIAGGNSGITGHVKPQTMVMGYPARSQEHYMKMLKATLRLPKLVEAVADLQKRVSKAGQSD